MASQTSVTLMLALDPLDWRAGDKATWAQTLVGAVEAAAPRLLDVEGYEIRDTIVFVRLRAQEPRGRFVRRLREDESFRRLRARLADLGARPEFEIGR